MAQKDSGLNDDIRVRSFQKNQTLVTGYTNSAYVLTDLHFSKTDEKDEKTIYFQIFFGEESLHDQYTTRMHRHALAANDISESKDPAMNVIYHDIIKHIFR